MDIKSDSPVPEMAAITAARNASDRQQALAAASDQRTISERVVFALLMMVIMLSAIPIRRFELLEIEPMAMVGIQITLLFVTALYSEILHLRRRVQAITYLLSSKQHSGDGA